MLDGRRYIGLLSGYKPIGERCPHCGTNTYSAGRKISFCNFCELPVDFSNPDAQYSQASQTLFAPLLEQANEGNLDAAIKGAEQLVKGNKDSQLLYLLGVLYRNISTARFQGKDYNQMGFMEPNAKNIRSSLDLTMRWKECFFKAIKVVDGEMQTSVQIDPELVFTRFMCEIRLQDYVNAATTLRSVQTLDKKTAMAEYALLVYSAEKNTKQAEPSLLKALESGELNAYYYLARYLAKRGKLREAEMVLRSLERIARVSMSQELVYRIRLTEDASKL